MYRIRPVSGYLLATYHDWRSNSLTIENLATGHTSVFSDSHLKDYEDVVGVVSDNQYLVSTRLGDTELCFLMLNGTNGAVREICRWDSMRLVVKKSMHCTGGVLYLNLICAVNASRSSVVILGPAETHTTPGIQDQGRPDPRQGIKCIHLRQDPLVIQVGLSELTVIRPIICIRYQSFATIRRFPRPNVKFLTRFQNAIDLSQWW